VGVGEHSELSQKPDWLTVSSAYDFRDRFLGLLALKSGPVGRDEESTAAKDGILGLRPSLPGLTTLSVSVSWTASDRVIPEKGNAR
jgi:hypothetical protein